MSKLRVLLVQDHLSERIQLLKVLTEYGVEIETAVNFARARELIKWNKYDIIISELLMKHAPELQGDGIQFWSYCRFVHPQAEMIILAEEQLRYSTELLFDGSGIPPMVSKPVCDSTLRQLIEESLNKEAA